MRCRERLIDAVRTCFTIDTKQNVFDIGLASSKSYIFTHKLSMLTIHKWQNEQTNLWSMNEMDLFHF